jgi:hypothetical protein
MNARPKIRLILVAKKLRHWSLVSRCPILAPKCPPARARKNYWRLYARYPEIAAKLGLTELSVYDPVQLVTPQR